MEGEEWNTTRKIRKKKDTDMSFENKYLAKLERYRNHMAKVRLKESPQQYEARLERARVHAAKMRQAESPEQRAARLERARLYKHQSRRNETPEQRSRRLENARKQTIKHRQNETPEQRQLRLERARLYNYQMRHNETPEKRQARLEYTRKYMTEMRKYKLFAGMIDQAEQDQWKAFQTLINPAVKMKYANNNTLPPRIGQTQDSSNVDNSIESSVPLDMDQCQSPLMDSQMPDKFQIKKELDTDIPHTGVHSSCDINDNTVKIEAKEQNNTFLLNSITSDIPSLHHEVDMVLNCNVLKSKLSPHPCPQCHKVYRYMQSLKKHLLSHA